MVIKKAELETVAVKEIQYPEDTMAEIAFGRPIECRQIVAFEPFDKSKKLGACVR